MRRPNLVSIESALVGECLDGLGSRVNVVRVQVDGKHDEGVAGRF